MFLDQVQKVMKSREEAAEEIRQLERHADEAGSTALALAAEIAQLRDDVDLLQDKKQRLSETVTDISDVITAKDAEFHDLLTRIAEASTRFGFYALIYA